MTRPVSFFAGPTPQNKRRASFPSAISTNYERDEDNNTFVAHTHTYKTATHTHYTKTVWTPVVVVITQTCTRTRMHSNNDKNNNNNKNNNKGHFLSYQGAVCASVCRSCGSSQRAIRKFRRMLDAVSRRRKLIISCCNHSIEVLSSRHLPW